ncbi:3-ketoacyl-CoA thiolase, mitochondrial-like [Clavelina lepadiformis]|uniref:3-ketoacyl-CoA thiolase, mitochondrial-like n=1 Tax=Clavelina lepadiformis TaxID=159417 RepID=UPI0040424F56
MALRRGIFIVAAKRTPFGTYGGALKDHTATDLQEIANKAALEAGNVSPEIVDSVFVGNVMQSAVDAAYIARHSAIRSGIPVHVPALTVNRLCGSGFQSIVSGAQELELGVGSVSLCGGSENMSQAPHTLYGARFGTKLGQDLKLVDSLWAGLTDLQCKTPMGVTAENLATKYGITREDTDRYARLTQSRWGEAQKSGKFDPEMITMTLKSKKGPREFHIDEHPRPDVTLEQLAKLPPVFKKDGTVSAGNASGVCDGASAVVIATEEACEKHGLKPLARIVAYSSVGCEPTIMGIGPVAAATNALAAANLKLSDMDICEVNEAFAPQYLAVEKELGLDPAKTNLCGGAIALGHPLGASGNRITAHLTHQLRLRNLKYAMGSACIGGGQGIAVILENAS